MLILIAHGSRDPVWRGSLEALTQSVGDSLPREQVRLAFMQFTGPTLPEVVREGLAAGHGEFRILPLFMASAGHVDKDVKPLVEELAAAHPEARLEVMTPLGEDRLLPHLIVDIANRFSTQG
jgi:sirohydrochlorin cobaltochelatase